MTERTVALPSLAGALWLTRIETRAVLAAINKGGKEARIVGGAVRNALIGEPVTDIDIATTALPDEVMRLAERAGLKPVATGLEHGTVTVVANHVPFEVTTLRRDIETFGRHARVTFTTDWGEDAHRRDFTINALYCSADGKVHDPIGGYADLAQRRVRFIGDAHDRIREDFLRILRFFRFTAEYASGAPDAAGLAACAELKDGLDKLSGERLRAELLRLLAASRAHETLAIMHKTGVLTHVLQAEPRPDLAARMAEIETALGLAPDPVRRLGALALTGPGSALALRDHLKLAGSEYERLAHMALPDRAFEPDRPELEAKIFLYRHGPEAFADGALLAWARAHDPPDDVSRRERLYLPQRWTAPECPVRGADVLALGVPAGPDVGRILSQFEDWWMAADFPLDPPLLATTLRRLALVTKS